MTTEVALKTVSANDGLRNLNLAVKTVNASWKANVAYLKSANDYLGASKAQYHGLTEEMEKQTHVLTSLKEKQGNITDTTTKGAAAFLRYEQDIKRAETKLTSLEAQQLRSRNAMEKQESGIVKLSQSIKTNNSVMDSYVTRLKAEGREEEALVQKKRQLTTESNKQQALYQKETGYLRLLEGSVGKTSEEYKKQKVVINNLGTEMAQNLSQQKALVAEQEKARLTTIRQKSGLDDLRKSYSLSKEVNSSYVNGLKSQGNNLKSLIAQRDNLKNSLKNGQVAYNNELTYLKKVERETGNNSDAYKRQVIEVNKSATSLNKMASELRTVQKNSDKIRPFTNSRFINGFEKASKASRQFGGALKDNISKYSALGRAAVVGMATVTAATGAGLIAGAKTATNLQDAYIKNRGLLVTGDVTGASAAKKMSVAQGTVNQMQKEGRNLSLEYGKSQQEVANGYQELIKRGYEGEQALGAYDAIVLASTAAHEDLGTVTEVTASTLDSFGMRVGSSANIMKNSNKVVNELAYAADATATNFKDIGVAMSYVGASAKQSGYSLAETSSALGVLSNNGLEAQKAGTGLRKTMSSLQAPTANGADALKKIGLSAKDFVAKSGDMKSMTEIFGILNKHTKEMGGAEKGVLFKALFGETGKQAGTILSQNADELGKLNKRVEEATKNNYVKDLAEKNMKSVQASLNRFKAAANDILQTIGAAIIPALGDVANAVSKAMQSKVVQDTLKKISDSLKEAGDQISKYVNNLKPKDFANGLQFLADAAENSIKFLIGTVKVLFKIGQGIAAIGTFAAKHKEAVKEFGKVLAAIWVVTKIAKFKKVLEDMGLLFSPQAKQVAILTEAIMAQNTMIAENTSLREINSGVSVAGGDGFGGTSGKTKGGKKGSKDYAMGEYGGQIFESEAKAAGKAGSTLSKTGSRVAIAAEAKQATKWGKTLSKFGKVGKVAKGAASIGGITNLAFAATDLIGTNKKNAGDHVGGFAGNLAGGAAGAAIGTAILPGIGTAIGAGVGALGGDKLGRALGKEIQKGLNSTKIKVGTPAISNKKAYDGLNKDAKKYYSEKQKQDLADLKLLRDNGDITKAEYNKRATAARKSGDDSVKFEKMSQSSKTATTKYYAESRNSLANKWDKKTQKDSDYWDDKMAKDILKWGANSIQVQEDQKKKDLAIKKNAKDRANAIEKQRLHFATEVTVAEAKLHTTLNGKIKMSADKEYKILSNLKKKKGKLNNQQLQLAVTTATKERNKVASLAEDQYQKVAKTAEKKRKKVSDSAERQYKAEKKSAVKTYNDTVKASENQFRGNSKNAKKQRADVEKEARKQRDHSIEAANEQKKKIIDHAKNQAKKTKEQAEEQRKKVVEKATSQMQAVLALAKEQSQGVVTSAETQATNSIIANGKQADGTKATFAGLGSWLNTMNDSVGGTKVVIPGASGNAAKLPTFSPFGAKATGGTINQGGKSLVGEAGMEARYKPYSGQIDLIGQNGAEFIDVHPGDQILNATDTKKLIAGNYGTTLPGYANGKKGAGSILSWIQNTASSTWDKVSDKAMDLFSKVTHPIDTLKKIAAGIFNPKSVAGVGSLQQNISQGGTDNLIHGIANVFEKMKAALEKFGGGSAPAGKGVQRWKSLVIKALNANGLSTSASMVNRVLRQIASESGGNEKAVQHGYTDVNSISGDLAKGLMQVIGTTFNANKFPGHGSVFNGYDNLLAGLHYAKAAYGNGLGALGNGHGYANGGIINKHGMVEVGEGDKQEYIIPMDKMKNTRALSLLGSAVSTLQAQNGGAEVNEGQNQINELTAQISTLTDIVTQFMGMVEAKPVISQRDIYKGYNSVRKVDLGLRKYNEGKTV